MINAIDYWWKRCVRAEAAVQELQAELDKLTIIICRRDMETDDDLRNQGCDIAATKLAEIARNGRNSGRFAAGPMEEAASEIMLLRSLIETKVEP